MDFNIITGFPSWYILICIFSGILASMILYFREARNEFPSWLKWLLGINRFIIVSLIAFLLLSPLLKMVDRHSEKPVIVVAHDNSMSIVMGSDSSYYKEQYLSDLNKVLDELSADFEVKLFTFGEEVNAIKGISFDSLEFQDKLTDMASLFDMMDARYASRNTGALIIAGDGIFNKGMNPLYHFAPLACPVYTIALGDTIVRRDAFIKRVLYNRIAFQGNDFPVEVILNAKKLNGATITMSLSEAGSTIAREQVAVSGHNFSKTVRLVLSASEPGMHHYVLRISANRDEVSRENNRFDLFVDVLRSKQKVPILSNAPHPDISALKMAVSSNINYELEDWIIDDFNGPVQNYNLVILHQLPSFQPDSYRLMDQLNRANVPVLYILGPQTDISTFNGQRTPLQLSRYNQSGLNEALPVLNDDFTVFSLSDGIKDKLSSLPPLNTHFASYEMLTSASALFYQKLGNIESTDPLWVLDPGSDVKKAVICGTGLWKWRMKYWLETGEHTMFNELVNKTVQFLAVKEDKRRFRLVAPESIPENLPVEVKAELYNKSYEPVNEPDVRLEIRDENENIYEYILNKTSDAYTLNAGNLPVGTYSYVATTRLGDEVFSDDGGFAIRPVVAEQVSLRAEHELLEALAEEHHGRMLMPEDLDSLPEIIKGRGDVKPIIHAEKKFIEFIDIWWVLVIILALLGVEWFMRKWSGSY